MIQSIADLKKIIKEKYPNELYGDKPRFLFRGENSLHSKMNTSFGRIADYYPDCIGYAYTLYRRAHEFLNGIAGYSIGKKEGIALLQHYGMPTPQIDFTANIDVAVFFALHEKKEGHMPYLYIFDAAKCPENLEVANHDFLVIDDLKITAQHRYVRQDGYGIIPKHYYDAQIAQEFDLKDTRYYSFLDKFAFIPIESEYSEVLTKDYIYDPNDALRVKMMSILNLALEHLEDGGNEIYVPEELKRRARELK